MKRCGGELDRACRNDGDCSAGATGPCIEHPSVPADLGWIQEPYSVALGCLPLACGPTDLIARVDTSPVFRLWPETTVHVGDCEIIPVATYEIQATGDGINFSAPLVIGTILLPELSPGFFAGYGDVAEAPIAGQYQPPGQIGNVVDIGCYVNTVQNYPSASPSRVWAHKTWPDLAGLGVGSPPNYILNAADLQAITQGLQDAKWLDNPGHTYPADCPPNCGDGYCDTDAGEDGTNCPTDCS